MFSFCNFYLHLHSTISLHDSSFWSRLPSGKLQWEGWRETAALVVDNQVDTDFNEEPAWEFLSLQYLVVSWHVVTISSFYLTGGTQLLYIWCKFLYTCHFASLVPRPPPFFVLQFALSIILPWTPLSCPHGLGPCVCASANQWAWHRKHVTTITSALQVLWTKCIPYCKRRKTGRSLGTRLTAYHTKFLRIVNSKVGPLSSHSYNCALDDTTSGIKGSPHTCPWSRSQRSFPAAWNLCTASDYWTPISLPPELGFAL